MKRSGRQNNGGNYDIDFRQETECLCKEEPGFCPQHDFGEDESPDLSNQEFDF